MPDKPFYPAFGGSSFKSGPLFKDTPKARIECFIGGLYSPSADKQDHTDPPTVKKDFSSGAFGSES